MSATHKSLQSDAIVSVTSRIKQEMEKSSESLTKAKAFKQVYESYAPYNDYNFDSEGEYYLLPEAHQYLQTLPFNLNDENIPRFLFGDNSVLEFSVMHGCSCEKVDEDEMWYLPNHKMAYLNEDGLLVT